MTTCTVAGATVPGTRYSGLGWYCTVVPGIDTRFDTYEFGYLLLYLVWYRYGTGTVPGTGMF